MQRQNMVPILGAGAFLAVAVAALGFSNGLPIVAAIATWQLQSWTLANAGARRIDPNVQVWAGC